MQIVLMVLGLVAILVAPALADESCPVKLQESQTQTLIVAQSREQYEQRLAQAIRSNHELGSMVDKASAEITKLKAEIAALKPQPDAPKPDAAKP